MNAALIPSFIDFFDYIPLNIDYFLKMLHFYHCDMLFFVDIH